MTGRDHWVAEAVARFEQVLDDCVAAFARDPYLYRVEHAQHVAIGTALAGIAHFAPCALADGHRVAPVQKEWPETRPRPKKHGRRGNFDFAVLSPNQLARHTVADFRAGRIEPAIVCEIGLDYGSAHLASDEVKLVNSMTPAMRGYLLHLHRQCAPDDLTRRVLFSPTGGIRTCAAMVFGTSAISKRVRDNEFSETERD